MSDLTTFRDHCAAMATAQHKPTCCRCGQSWCCGCIGHPVGKPWGWAELRWREHAETCPSNPSAPPCPGCLTDADRELFARLAAEVDDYLEPHPTLWGDDADSEPATGARSAAGAVPGVVGPDEDGESL